jgi:hypothetical protein
MALAVPLPRRPSGLLRLLGYAVVALTMSVGGTAAAWPSLAREYGLID